MSGSILHGVDVSRWQGDIDWHQVAGAGYSFGLTRVSVGMRSDPTAAANLRGMRAAGMVPGAYHVVYPDSTPYQQITHFLSEVRAILGGTAGVLLMVDAETIEGVRGGDPTQLAAMQCAWQLARQSGRPEIDYFPGWWLRHVGWDPAKMTDWPGRYWKSAYLPDALHPPTTRPSPPPGWPDVVGWQWTDAGRVPGITGRVDLDVYFGDLQQLRALAGAPTSTPTSEDDQMITAQGIAQIRAALQAELEEIMTRRLDAHAETIRELLRDTPGQGHQLDQITSDVAALRAEVGAITQPAPAPPKRPAAAKGRAAGTGTRSRG